MIKKMITTLLLLLLCMGLSAEGLRNIPLSNPVYLFLEKAYVYGCIDYISQARPYTESQTLDYLQDIHTYIIENKIDLPASFLENLNYFKEQFNSQRETAVFAEIGENSTLHLQPRFNLHIDSNLVSPGDTIPAFTGDIELSASFDTSFYLSLNMETILNYWGWSNLPYKPYHSPGIPDKYVFAYSLDNGSSGFNHEGTHTAGTHELVVTTNAESQLSVDLEYLTFGFNKGNLDWGPSRVANLALSKQAKPFEYFGFNLPFGDRGMFSWLTGFLYDPTYSSKGLNRRLLAIQRVEYQITDWLLLALYESILYDYTFEMAFINPFTIYYVAEVNQGTETSNKLGGFDLIFRLPKSKIYLAMYSDDWDMKDILSFNASHNEWIGTLGVHYFDLIPDLTLLFEYTYVSHWMYTHFTDPIPNISSKSYQHYLSPLGHFLGPNSHMIHLQGDYDLSLFMNAGSSLSFIQDGRGDINTPPNWGAENTLHGVTDYRDIYYSFLDIGKPGFTVTTIFDWSIFGSLIIPEYDISLKGTYSLEYSFINKTEDWALVEGSPRVDHFISLDISWLY